MIKMRVVLKNVHIPGKMKFTKVSTKIGSLNFKKENLDHQIK